MKLEDYYKPFEDFEKSIYDRVFTRVIKEDVKQEQLIWHKDKKDRIVKVVYGTGWKLQNDNELPTELEIGQNYHINKEQFHRLHKGSSELKLEIKEYD
jgi:hypothetical protein|tara:strand:+ start:139 stop:432 length:294 start_codon:yes stop_codon:yes gene_type:complete